MKTARPATAGTRGPLKGQGGAPKLPPGEAGTSGSVRMKPAAWATCDELRASAGPGGKPLSRGDMIAQALAFYQARNRRR